MPSGMQVWGPDGALWFDTNENTSRVVGVLTFTSIQTETTINYPAPAGTNPWAYAFASNGLNAQAYVGRPDANTASVTYVLGYPASGSWPPNGQVHIIYGWA
ncbi:hypothetical protein [Sphingomonas nostoxanthinifaciens]|uniref:hypothetical protein n=1 Tax=Sphingomonas nostoxanthinifaciens TaxID=2872652 RepID=UPI001CC202FE|nr:hypothetical protein [Sphingomonas nostoxanthinifaciens]UAK25869.1 hypothetical protein K8P63_07040 [Sphingomonas nostoxanthinifaciens]